MSAFCRDVTVSVVSHRQWELAKPLIDQLNEHCSQSVARITVTINVAEEAAASPQWSIPVSFIHNARPRGFGANHNAAARSSTTAWFLVLNPDIRLDSDVVSVLVGRAKPSSGALAPRIQEPGKAEPEPYRDLLTPAELLRRRSSRHRPPDRPAWVAGMFVLLRREAFIDVDGFDERFFMYCEDFDLCARLRLAGWSLQVEPDVRVLHIAQRASQSSLLPLAWHLTSLWRVWTSRTFWRYLAMESRGRRGCEA